MGFTFVEIDAARIMSIPKSIANITHQSVRILAYFPIRDKTPPNFGFFFVNFFVALSVCECVWASNSDASYNCAFVCLCVCSSRLFRSTPPKGVTIFCFFLVANKKKISHPHIYIMEATSKIQKHFSTYLDPFCRR